VLVVGVVLLLLSPLRAAGSLQERVGGIVGPVGGALRDATRPAADVLLRAGQLRELSAENADLRRRVSRLEADLATLREQQIAVQQASALLSAVGPAAGQFITASVVLRDPAPGHETVLLDHGSSDGVRVGQPVLSAGATLAGIVVDVGAHRARVRLLIDPQSSVAALVQSSRTPGAATGTGDALQLDFVQQGASVANGDLVLTSALGGQLPGGLLIGRVSAVHSRPADLFQTVDVEPLADYLRLEQVLIMTGFVPGSRIDVGDAAP
jgi:rod shape-determining protein MreC